MFAKCYTPNWLQEVFIIKDVKYTVAQIHVIKDFKNAEIVETFYEKELQKKNQIEFRVEKVIKRKGESFMSSETVMIIHLITGLITNTYYKYIM